MQTHRTALLVLDEADQLLAPHFRSELLRLLEHVGAPARDLPADNAVRVLFLRLPHTGAAPLSLQTVGAATALVHPTALLVYELHEAGTAVSHVHGGCLACWWRNCRSAKI